MLLSTWCIPLERGKEMQNLDCYRWPDCFQSWFGISLGILPEKTSILLYSIGTLYNFISSAQCGSVIFETILEIKATSVIYFEKSSLQAKWLVHHHDCSRKYFCSSYSPHQLPVFNSPWLSDVRKEEFINGLCYYFVFHIYSSSMTMIEFQPNTVWQLLWDWKYGKYKKYKEK